MQLDGDFIDVIATVNCSLWPEKGEEIKDRNNANQVS